MKKACGLVPSPLQLQASLLFLLPTLCYPSSCPFRPLKHLSLILNNSEASELSLPWKKLKSSFLLCLGTCRGCGSFSAAAWEAAAPWGLGWGDISVHRRWFLLFCPSVPCWSCESSPAHRLLPSLLLLWLLALPQQSWPCPVGQCP